MTGPNLPKVALIAGPTASGKSALAIALAEKRGGMVINADSAQVYADLRILTARPSEEEEARVPHRLFGHIDGADTYSAARWAAEARAAIHDAHAHGLLPILVGGTGLYLLTLLDGIAPIPEIEPEIREEIRAMPVADAHAHLTKLDPEAAARLHPSDTTRVARALEVIRSTGFPLAYWHAERTGGIGGEIALSAKILLPDRNWLHARTDTRFEMMLESGAVDEVRQLEARTDLSENAPVRRAIGVREIADWQAGLITRDEALARAQAATRQYAKRQYTWFRRQPPGAWERTTETETYTLLDQFERKLFQ
ncbi:tRNA (adenosine(37)-N6)-dimethylallyltransferase MiaA [Sphingomonas sp. LB-2]|uniref:tRNA (adenosine(37)-N6)-dimethylallyltransferase MiaA n=1 Tax=Sphingomonas caeni TaxID=2984949 RepID=UPI00222F6408|nr:tRNA (adenosine(37)-N6)-dimethylallyltransferase MiaA [Sphingomonas caeni]MCW3848473.1 tRNA (adenosine(37)-N6)-dimethylallyltransferase MiaA [Sphingomonas caeni]